MRADLPALLPLVCPRCRTRTGADRDMRTVSLVEAFARDGNDDDEILEGALACDDDACGARYPIVDGVPLFAPDPAAWLRSETPFLLEAARTPELLALLAAAGPDDAPLPRLLDHLSVYLDAHWGDRAEPPPDVPPGVERFGLRALADRVAARAAARPVERAVDLGCGVGRALAELAHGAQIAVGLDLHVGAVRRARRLLAGEAVPYARRVTGRFYARAVARAGSLASPDAAVLCADALDPPLVPGAFERVVAFNVLDSVSDPAGLLSVADGLLAPGGELLFACPYAFQSGIVDEEARPAAADPAAWLRQRLARGDGLEAAYTILDEEELPWSLRRDARSAQVYRVHYLRAEKGVARDGERDHADHGGDDDAT